MGEHNQETQAAPWFKGELPGLLVALAGLVFTLVFMEATPWEIRVHGLPVDQALQDHFFNFTSGQWLVDKSNTLGRLLFYDGPKIAIIVLGSLALISVFIPRRFLRWLPERRNALFLAVAVAVAPMICNRGKTVTNMYCPDQHERYGGQVPYTELWNHYPPTFREFQKEHPSERGRGFPAGHASGGFALMALAFMSRRRLWGVLAGSIAGWWMGGYQMLKGAHYLSHTLTTWCLVWLILVALAALIRPTGCRLGTVRDERRSPATDAEHPFSPPVKVSMSRGDA